MVVGTASAHARAHAASSLSVLGLFAVPAVLAVLIAFIAVARVIGGKAHPLKGAGSFLLGCVVVPLGAWLAHSAGSHAAANLFVFLFVALVVSVLFVSSLVAAAATNCVSELTAGETSLSNQTLSAGGSSTRR
jgi:heme/copper-type cytochrome/quinol oxidase subunit 4